MALDLQSLSITSIFNSIVSFFKSQENNSKWKDLTTGSEGIFLIRLLSNVLSNISYRLVSARRENYISTANLLSSNLGIAVNLGYSAFRGTNQKRLVRLTPNSNYVLNKLSVIGTYNSDYDIILLDNTTLQNGVPIDIKTAIGKVKELTFTAGTSAIKIFSQFTDRISEDFVLLKDNVEMPTTNIIKELKDDKYLVRTNPYASVDILYLNNSATAAYKYGTETQFTLKYIELADVPTITYLTNMFTYGTLNNTLTIDNYTPFETVDSIKVNAPLNHEVQNLIRSKPDYSQRIKQIVPNIKESSYTPITPTYTLVTYLKDDFTIIKEDEQNNLEAVLDEENYFGTPLPDITPPRREASILDIYLSLSNKYTAISDINIDIDNILKNNYATALSQTFNVFSLERLLEDNLSYVKYARVSFNVGTRQNGAVYQLGNIINENTYNYKAGKIIGTSGETEPSWNLPTTAGQVVDTGLETQDGNIIWKAYKRLAVDNITEWASNTRYATGEYVYSNIYANYMFKCIDLVKSSGATAPDVSTTVVGDFIIDGSIVWVCKLYNISYSQRQSITKYRLGDSVNIGTLSFECISYVGTSGGAAPIFELLEYPISSYTTSTFVLSGDKTLYFKANDTIKATATDNVYTFSILTVVYDDVALTTTITTKQNIQANTGQTYTSLTPTPRGTQDGEILWEIVPDITQIPFNWNVYNVFSYNLTTSYGGA